MAGLKPWEIELRDRVKAAVNQAATDGLQFVKDTIQRELYDARPQSNWYSRQGAMAECYSIQDKKGGKRMPIRWQRWTYQKSIVYDWRGILESKKGGFVYFENSDRRPQRKFNQHMTWGEKDTRPYMATIIEHGWKVYNQRGKELKVIKGTHVKKETRKMMRTLIREAFGAYKSYM